MSATTTAQDVDTAALAQPTAAERRAALTRRLDDQAEREADDRQSRLLAGIPDFDRWPA